MFWKRTMILAAAVVLAGLATGARADDYATPMSARPKPQPGIQAQSPRQGPVVPYKQGPWVTPQKPVTPTKPTPPSISGQGPVKPVSPRQSPAQAPVKPLPPYQTPRPKF